jgi:hypothetical protein
MAGKEIYIPQLAIGSDYRSVKSAFSLGIPLLIGELRYPHSILEASVKERSEEMDEILFMMSFQGLLPFGIVNKTITTFSHEKNTVNVQFSEEVDNNVYRPIKIKFDKLYVFDDKCWSVGIDFPAHTDNGGEYIIIDYFELKERAGRPVHSTLKTWSPEEERRFISKVLLLPSDKKGIVDKIAVISYFNNDMLEDIEYSTSIVSIKLKKILEHMEVFGRKRKYRLLDGTVKQGYDRVKATFLERERISRSINYYKNTSNIIFLNHGEIDEKVSHP